MTKEKINLRARINRHVRIASENGGKTPKRGFKTSSQYNIMFVLFMILCISPVYPSLSAAVYNETDIYKGRIDEDSILETHMYGEGEGEEDIYVSTEDNYLSVDLTKNTDRDLSGASSVIQYKVKPGESYGSIANDFGVSVQSILWANNFSSSHVINPDDIIKVPPVTGLVYIVKKGESIEIIAKRYKIAKADIEKQNNMSSSDVLKIGQTLILPGAKKIIPKPKPKPKPVVVPEKTYVKNTSGSSKTFTRSKVNKKSVTKAPVSKAVAGTYKQTPHGWRNRFPRGYCTWYVAQYKRVNWRGNANQWIANARAKGHLITKTPLPGDIIQFGGGGYDRRYGHVGLVIGVQKNTITVRDMNYSAFNRVTTRIVKKNDWRIQGYIRVK